MKNFNPTSYETWKEQALKDVKSQENFDALFHAWGELSVGPYYAQAPSDALIYAHRYGTGDVSTGESRFWYNVIGIDGNSENANAHALQNLMDGANGIHFTNVAASSVPELLQDILAEYVHLSFELDNYEAADVIRSYFDEEKSDSSDVKGYIQYQGTKEITEHCYRLFEQWPLFRSLCYNVPALEDPVAQLNETLQWVIETIDQLSEFSDPSTIARNMAFIIDLGTEYLRDIIRVRALRLAVYKLLRSMGASLNPEDIFIHARSVPWQKEPYSQEANMIKSSVAAMAGILGGCNALSVLPLSDTPMEQRIARNVSPMLTEESYLQ